MQSTWKSREEAAKLLQRMKWHTFSRHVLVFNGSVLIYLVADFDQHSKQSNIRSILDLDCMLEVKQVSIRHIKEIS